MSHCFESHAMGSLYERLLRRLVLHGHRVSPRGLLTKELLNVHLTLKNPLANVLFHPQRDLNYRFMVAEWLWIMFGHNEVKYLTPYNAKMANYSDDGETLWGSYGPRLKNQWLSIQRGLVADAKSRKLVLEFWRPEALVLPTKDAPCTLTMQFLLRDSKLHCIVNMRSSDVWLGLPYDIFNFSMIQNVLAGEFKVSLGELHLNLGSSHLYEEHFKAAEQTLKTSFDWTCTTSPTLPGFPVAELDRHLCWDRGQEPTITELDHPWSIYQRVLSCTKRAQAWEVLDAAVSR